MRLSGPRLYYRTTVKDSKGRIVRRSHKLRSHSWIRQFLDLLCCQMRNDDVSAKDTSGTTRTVNVYTLNLKASGVISDDVNGIVVGNNDMAEDISNSGLGNRIVEGTGSGELTYLAQSNSDVALDGQSVSFTMTRIFVNSSGAEITIKEIGIYGLGREGGNSHVFVMVRDVLGAPEAIPDGGAYTVEYTLTILL